MPAALLHFADECIDEDDDDVFVPQKVERSHPQSPEELMGVLEGVRAMEALVQAADESQRENKYKSTDK